MTRPSKPPAAGYFLTISENTEQKIWAKPQVQPENIQLDRGICKSLGFLGHRPVTSFWSTASRRFGHRPSPKQPFGFFGNLAGADNHRTVFSDSSRAIAWRDACVCARIAATMLIGERLREIREAKNLSQGDIEKRTGLIRCYVSRVENGHTVPSVETLEKFVRALEVPLYQLFYEGEELPKLPQVPKRVTGTEIAFGRSKKEARYLIKIRRLLSRMTQSKRQLLLDMAQEMARR